MKNKFLFLIFYLIFYNNLGFSDEPKIIFVIKSKDNVFYNDALKGFKKTMREKNILTVFKEFKLESTGVLEKIINEKVDLIFTLGTSDTKIVAENIKDIPIVFSTVYNPEHNGLKAENLTGASLDITGKIQLETMKKIIPKMKRIGVIYNPEENKIFIKEATKIAADMGFELKVYPVKTTQEIPEVKDLEIDVLWLIPDILVCQSRIIQRIILDSIKMKIPVIGISQYYVKAGAIMALTCDYEDIGKQSAEIAVKILNGENISSIPVTKPRKTKIYLNMIVANTVGIKIPDEIIKEAEK